MSENTPALIAFVVILGPPFLVGVLVGWLLRGRRDARRWRTGAATPRQITYLQDLAREAGEDIDVDGLTRERASAEIDRLKAARRDQSAGDPSQEPPPVKQAAIIKQKFEQYLRLQE